jgi:hypothetical protein
MRLPFAQLNAARDETVPVASAAGSKTCLGISAACCTIFALIQPEQQERLMADSAKPIAVVQGAASAAIQQLLREFAGRVPARVVGLVEDACSTDGTCGGPGRLLGLSDGRSYPLFQDLGEGSASCGLDAEGVISAGEAMRRDIARGCDLVVLSKFGKLEAENRAGLIPAFGAAIEAGVPVLTAVSPKFAAAWEAFAAPFYCVLPAEAEALDAWWAAVRTDAPALYAV